MLLRLWMLVFGAILILNVIGAIASLAHLH